MIARKRIDIEWSDLALGLGACFRAEPPRANGFCDSESLISLSVRSGFDLLLSELALPAGSEVLVSALTIPAMPRILAEHKLVAVPVDLDPSTLSVTAEALRSALTPRTRAVLVAHLFGSHMDLGPVLAVAREHGLLVIEDCAQAFAGAAFKGHPESGVRMFSFGPIKTATAIGGAVLFVRDAALRERMRQRQASYPQQSRLGYFRRLVTFSLFKMLLAPGPYSVIIGASRLSGRDHDEIVTRLGQSFAGPDFFAKIRQRPCAALECLVRHRVSTYPMSQIEERAQAGQQVMGALPVGTVYGESAPWHTFWVFPILTDLRHELRRKLCEAGFDAASGATSLCAVEPPADRPEQRPRSAEAAMARVLYLPTYASVRPAERLRQARVVAEVLRGETTAPEPLTPVIAMQAPE